MALFVPRCSVVHVCSFSPVPHLARQGGFGPTFGIFSIVSRQNYNLLFFHTRSKFVPVTMLFMLLVPRRQHSPTPSPNTHLFLFFLFEGAYLWWNIYFSLWLANTFSTYHFQQSFEVDWSWQVIQINPTICTCIFWPFQHAHASDI